MKLKKYIPLELVAYLNLIKSRRRFPNNNINSGQVGANVRLGKECWINRDVIIGDNVVMGDYSYVNRGTIIASGKIGKYCSIAAHCQIGLDEHPSHFFSTSPFTYDQQAWDTFQNPPIIDHDVWIGVNVIVMQGVHIGTGAILAAGAVVTKDVPPYMIVGGVPAKIIKPRFETEVIDKLLREAWWDNIEPH
ncbi:antibiotic acetyltransferase [Listeria grandensis]|uniref:Antibiotic acetyltransferase n=1 Tax=Listeria grandensis TaxID=1494963 RepID=A0A7X0Y6B3_9LIST|nr:CatB-related O-acetyltransferase [Listeria grandensis]MBC1937548.1 antibiotic acetyltransferase [Listeria grandensis]